jgi:hypothetical protein
MLPTFSLSVGGTRFLRSSSAASIFALRAIATARVLFFSACVSRNQVSLAKVVVNHTTNTLCRSHLCRRLLGRHVLLPHDHRALLLPTPPQATVKSGV